MSDDRPTHSWTLPQQHLNIAEESDGFLIGAALLTPEDAERLAENLRSFRPDEVGGRDWMRQHEALQRLNMQAHQSAKTNSDEFVVEALLTFEKVSLLVKELLVVEAWKEKALPHLLENMDRGPASMRCYFVFYHEAVLCNLLETILFHDYGVEALQDSVLEFVDYCARKLTKLNHRQSLEIPLRDGMDVEPGESNPAGSAVEEGASAPAHRELVAQLQETELSVCLSALRLARFLAEHIEKMPLSGFNRLVEVHDVLMLIVPLVDNPPWARRRREKLTREEEQENQEPSKDGKKKKKKRGKHIWEKLDENNKWSKVDAADLLKLTPIEVNAWLLVFFLTCTTEIRKSYHLNSFRKASLLRIRKFINDMVLDQLPVLADVQRLMDELAVVDVPEPSGLHNTGLMMQQVAREREHLMTKVDWDQVAQQALQNQFSRAHGFEDLKHISDMYTGDDVLDFLEPRKMGEVEEPSIVELPDEEAA